MDTLDSRVGDVKKRGLVNTPWGAASRVYCVHCGALGGIVTEEAMKLIIYLCDDCFYANGHLPGLEEVEEATIKKFFNTEEVNFAH